MEGINQEKFSAINKFSSFVSHELKNSITVIKNAAYYLENSKNNYNKNQKKMFAFLNKEINRAYSKIVLLLDDTRIKYLNVQSVNIGDFLKKALAKHNDSKFNFKINAESNIRANIDKNRFHQVILIIIDNAKDAMPYGGDILVKVYSLKSKAIVEIKDFGYGMNKETLKNCFDPLFTTKKFQLGMSLTVAKQIILMLDGKITAKSVLNKGSKFSIELPKV
ncbi:MAG: HAMP domain-containing histidine kinase [Elusimicrobiota bacterium]|nr:HAMP domain-containing histidine kinase [Elusimicrobiota bacterium]